MAGKKQKSAGTPAIKQLAKHEIIFRVIEYEADVPDDRPGGYGRQPARSIDVDSELICKTLLAELADGELVVAVIPVGNQLNLRALAKAANTKKAAMASPEAAERRTGYVVGGISPFGQRRAHRTFVCESLAEADEIFVSGGRRGLEVVVAAEAFMVVLGAVFCSLVVA